ncbi:MULTISPECIES: restriction endonuclease [unclassified Streptomyces]|uniref:Restriction endonuclease n=1 Tax=Streptomyces sp. NBC_00060 TaxID=2975636 RepID=A0AAU2H4Q9_9ACTN
MDQISTYRALHHAAPGQEQARGRQFNAFLADLLRRGNLHDARSDLRGLHGRDEIDVHFTLGYTSCILEAKWERERVDETAIAKLKGRLETRRPGVQGFFVSMSGYTKAVYDKAEYHAQILLMDRQHVEAMVAGLFSADRLFHELLSVTGRQGGAYVLLAGLLDTPAAAGEPLPALRPVDQPIEGFPAWPEAGLTVSSVLTSGGPWAAGKVDGMASTADGRLLWTTREGVLQVAPDSGASMWTTAPSFCHGPALSEADGSMVVLVEEAALRFCKDSSVDVASGGFVGSRQLLPGPDNTAWVFASSGPRRAEGHGGHTLTQLAADFPDGVTCEVDFPGWVHQAVLTGAGSLYISGGGHSVTTDCKHNWRCPADRWADSAPLTPDAALAVGDHTVLLAGRSPQGFEKAVYAVDIHDHTSTLLLRLPNTTQITGFAHGPDDMVYLLTDIRGNDQTPRPHLLQLELPATMLR